MNKWHVAYFIVWLLTTVAYSLPWARAGEKVFVGWNFTIPFSITYVIGMILGLIVLLLKYKPVALTIVAGILMFLGIVGASLGFGLAGVLGALTGEKVTTEAGIGLAFLATIIYMVLGAYAGKKMGSSIS